MIRIEDSLREALRAEAPSAGFAAGVMGALAQQERAARKRWVPLAFAAGIAMGVVAPSGMWLYERHRAMEAREQLRQALSITRVQLREVRQQIRNSTGSKL